MWVNTKLNIVNCEYIYQKASPSKPIEYLERRPHDPNKNFALGEFSKLFQKALETVDMIFSDGIDWQAFLVSFQKLQEEQKLRIEGGDKQLPVVRAIENKDDGTFVIRVSVSPDANKGEIEKFFKRKYGLALKAREEEYRKLLQSKNKDITDLEQDIAYFRHQNTNLLDIIKLQASTSINITQIQGNNMAGDRKINIKNGNYNERIEGDYIQGNYYAAGEKQNLAQAAAEIQQLLEQLSKSYPSDTTTGKMTIATEAIKTIESKPKLMEKIISALKAGGVSALEQTLNHPAASFVIGALEDWQGTQNS